MTVSTPSPRRHSTCRGGYFEPDPTVGQWLQSLVPTFPGFLHYLSDVFLCTRWLPSYCPTWLLGDAIAGLTVGFVVIPQAMAYALLAKLTPEYGLYTSFVGAVLYWIFGTSKDIVIGTTAVGSLLIGSVVTSVQAQVDPGTYSNEDIAKAASAISGLILLGLGMLRLGWIIEFIPYIPISAFVTAAAVTIMSTQFPTLMGITGIDTRQAPYLVIIDSLKALPNTKMDAAIGLTSLVLLFGIRFFCDKMKARFPKQKKTWAIASSLRLTFTILLYTFISWLVNRNVTGKTPFRIVGHIERGFKHAGPPPLDQGLVMHVLPKIPAIIIILIIEHVAIAKSFGRQYGYTVVPSQEMLAQGASNFFGTFIGGYACTGSFGASAVLSKAGVRTPLAGLYSAIILVLALYALTAVFYYIPMAALAGLIIHAVLNLPTPPKTVIKYWKLGPAEFLIWWAGVLIAIFESLEVSIYVTICLSLALLLVRLAHARGFFLGQALVYRPLDPPLYYSVDHEHDHERIPWTADTSRKASCVSSSDVDNNRLSMASEDTHSTSTAAPATLSPRLDFDVAPRHAYLPFDHQDNSNPSLSISTPFPGIFIYRFPTILCYANQAQHMQRLTQHIKAHTRAPPAPENPADRLWCEAATPTLPACVKKDDSSSEKDHAAHEQDLPPLRAVILDCSAIDTLDITSIQGLVDARKGLDRHANCEQDSSACVQWHFAGVWNPWTRKALVVAGFGVLPSSANKGATKRTGENKPDLENGNDGIKINSSDQAQQRQAGAEPETDGEGSGADSEDLGHNPIVDRRVRYSHQRYHVPDKIVCEQISEGTAVLGETEDGKLVPVRGTDRPFFHLDLADAVDAAVVLTRCIEARGLGGKRITVG